MNMNKIFFPKKVFIKTYGCQMNVYDSTRIADLFQQTGQYQIVDTANEADVILLNTCSIREKAQEKVFSDLGRYRLMKQEKPNLVIGVGGCVAVQEKEQILKRAPYVNFVFSPTTIHQTVDMVKAAEKNHQPSLNLCCGSSIEKFQKLPAPQSTSVSASVTIMEGCNHFCTYCIVPYTRGREISRPFSSILKEIKTLSELGARDITLLGQNVNAYIDHEEAHDFPALLRAIATLPNIDRIRFTTSHPCAFSDRLIDIYRDVPKLVSHLHLPVQSGSNPILKAMRRGYTREEFSDKVRRLKKIRPTISISSDFIVGFPGETQEDFEATLSLVDEVGFDHSFSFVYSARPGTPAAKIPDDVPLVLKRERLQELQKRLYIHEQRIGHNMVNTIQPVLITGFSKKDSHELSGRTENNRIVNFFGGQKLIGQLVNVKITQQLTHSLRGALVTTKDSHPT
jgi:tRNA-2-methylthio-N6-dimethylallyladenosine synthase